MLRHHWFKKLCIVTPLLLTTAQCRHVGSREPAAVPALKGDQESILVEDGESAQPSFSADDKRMLFVSRKRPGHQGAQVYEKDLDSGTETRITFQNGDTSSPHYNPREEAIIYASTTDELKENPPLLRPASLDPKIPANFQEPSEIYVHSLRGLEITRLTDSPGYDGDPLFSHDGNAVIFTRARNDKLEVMSIDRRSHSAKPIKGLGTNPADFTMSNDGKWRAWVDWDAAFGVGKLRVQKTSGGPLAELNPDEVVNKTDLNFSGDSKWLLWSQQNMKTGTYQLWSYELSTSCARALPSPPTDDRRDPALSNDGKRLVYTLVRKGRSRIAQVAFTPPSGPCAAKP